MDEIHAAGGINGRKLAYNFEDSQSDPRQSVAIAQKFVSDPRVVMELGDLSSPASMAASPIYQRAALFPRLGQRLSQRAGSLSGGGQQMVAMARALMSRPRMIVMDEPTMGLSSLYVDRVLDLIRTINKDGVSVFMVEQNASLALEIAHEAYVLQTGRIVLSGPARTLKDDPRVRDAYLGGVETS